MDHQLEEHHKNNPIPSPFTQFYSSKKAIQILLSLSLFSFLFSQSSLLPLFSPTFSIKLLSYSADRNYIFLLCNGILFVIIKSSGLFSNAPTDTEFRGDHVKKTVLSDDGSKDFKNYDIKKNDESHQSSVPADHVISETKTEVVEVDEAKGQISTKEESDENVISSSAAPCEVENEDEEDQLLKIVQDEEEEEDQLLNFIKEKGDEFLDIKEQEEENEGLLLSAEELNKKCDDFIRKMKDGIKIEAQRHIMVYCQGL